MIEKTLLIEPDLLALSANKSAFFPALLESQSHNEKIGCYDILFAAPSIELVAYNQQELNELLKTIDSNPNQLATKSPFQCGWFLYFSYESAYFMEPKLSHLINKSDEPLAIAIYCQGCVVVDHFKHETTLWADSQLTADAIMSHLACDDEALNGQVHIDNMIEENGSHFEQSVSYAKELIQAGDIYQANLSRQYVGELTELIDPTLIFASLRKANPAPFAGLLKLNSFAVVSSSPERLFSIKNNIIETRPIAGTRPRGHDQAEDEAMIKELLSTPKERAEHIMLIDLERNDIGKVCETGSVEVDELMIVETYEHVHHIVSNIKGQLKPEVTCVDALKALFPGGTITGCPKIRCMEVIHEIEQRQRSCYTGSMGYLNHDGQMDLNILIRTVCVNNKSIKFNAGAGIVYDSEPHLELIETRHKAKGMMRALNQDNKQIVMADVKQS
ncbi:MAG: aminodeoxychorismate synthase component I [Marinicella sp.]